MSPATPDDIFNSRPLAGITIARRHHPSSQKKKNLPVRHPRRQAGKNRRERFFASEASPKGAYQG